MSEFLNNIYYYLELAARVLIPTNNSFNKPSLAELLTFLIATAFIILIVWGLISVIRLPRQLSKLNKELALLRFSKGTDSKTESNSEKTAN